MQVSMNLTSKVPVAGKIASYRQICFKPVTQYSAVSFHFQNDLCHCILHIPYLNIHIHPRIRTNRDMNNQHVKRIFIRFICIYIYIHIFIQGIIEQIEAKSILTPKWQCCCRYSDQTHSQPSQNDYLQADHFLQLAVTK